MQSAGLIEAQLAPRAPSPIDCALAEACGRPRMGRFRGQAPSAARLPHSAYGSFLGFFAPSGLTGKDSNGSN